MNPATIYDYLTIARARLFDHARPLTPEEYTRGFPIGLGSLARTLTHIMICEWMYVQRITGAPVPPYEQWPIKDETPPPFPTIESTWTAQAAATRAALAASRDWDRDIEYRITDDHGRPVLITATAADIATQLILHEVHHRAQAMNMLRHLGRPTGDLDYNDLIYQRRPAE